MAPVFVCTQSRIFVCAKSRGWGASRPMPIAAALRAASSFATQKAAIAASLPYVIHSDGECERLELQARLANIEGHLRHLPITPGDCVLDIGCGSGSMARLIGHSFP